MKNLKIIFAAIIIVIAAAVVAFIFPRGEKLSPKPNVVDFETCKQAGGIVLEKYPSECRIDSRSFTENIGNELELTDLIKISQPRPNQKIKSPLEIKGEARGTWFFEASFPVTLIDSRGNVLAKTNGQADGEWMTEEFVPFTSTVEFKTNDTKGTLILEKDNPSGLPENAKKLEIPVIF